MPPTILPTPPIIHSRPVAFEAIRRAPQARPALCSIMGMGHYLPARMVHNDEIALTVDTSDQWIFDRTGIHGRHHAGPDQATSDLAVIAARHALADAGISARDLDLIITATSTPDSPVPATACHVQAKLGLGGSAGGGVPAMDVVAGCAGFGYALHMAAGMVSSGMHKCVLVTGADTLTRITNYTDRQSCILFGDGAGAMIVGPSLPSGAGKADILYSNVGADGATADMICMIAGGSRVPASAESVAANQHTLQLRGREVFKAAVRQMSDCLRKAADALGITPADFDLVIPHQANARIIEAIGTQMHIAPEKLLIDIVDTGNTAAASIPLAIGRARAAGRLKHGQLVAAVGYGAGTSWACQVARINER